MSVQQGIFTQPQQGGGGKTRHRQMTSGVTHTTEVKKSIRSQEQNIFKLPKVR